MNSITFEVITNGDIELCRDLCNELMAFQKSKATIEQSAFDGMNFDSRMKTSYTRAEKSHIVVIKDNGTPVGYVFSTIDNVTEKVRRFYPDWAPKGQDNKGFFPDWIKLPQKIGCLNNLYLRDAYQGKGIGSKLCAMAMAWLESFSDSNISFVYISNGNDDAYDFYIKHGFSFSHDVFGGFIKAAFKQKNSSL